LSVIQILDDADVAFRISGAELRTVLSATTMLADKPHRLRVTSRRRSNSVAFGSKWTLSKTLLPKRVY